MENTATVIEDKDFVRLEELGCFKNRPFKFPRSKEVLGLDELTEKKLKQESCYKTLSLLKDILDVYFSADKGDYVPTSSDKDAEGKFVRRTWLPEDMTPEQAEILFRNLDKIESFYIKAKVADILFEFKKTHKIHDRDRLTVAEEAIKAYFDSANYILYNGSDFQYSFRYAADQLKRAAQITLSLGKSIDSLFDKLMEFFKREEFFKEDKNCILITSLGEIICGIKNLPEDKIDLALKEYVKIFKIRNPEDTWATGVKLSKKAKNLNYERYFNKQKGDAHCGMAERFRSSPYHRGEYIKKAILAYRDIPEMKDKIEQLNKEKELVKGEVEKQIQTNTKVLYSEELNSKELIEELLEKELSGLKFEECLSKLVTLCIDCLYENYDYIIKTKSESPLFNNIGAKHYNNGKSVYNANSKEKNIFLNLHILFNVVAFLIKAGLKIINKEHSFSYDTLLNLVKDSSFVPSGHCVFFAKGLNYFLHNEMLEAVSLLVPQIENSLRHILGSPSIVHPDLTEKEKIDIHELFDSCVKKEILDEKFRSYLEDILAHQVYSLRHDIAHGKADDTIGNKDISYVACILILFLVLKPTGVLKTKCDESEKLNSILSKIVRDDRRY